MLTVHQLSKSFGLQSIFTDISFSINAFDKAALIGENGCGKTTLIRIILGLEMADKGSVQFTPSRLRVGYLPQGLRLPEEVSIGAFLNSLTGDLDQLSIELEEISARIADNPSDHFLATEYDDILSRLILTQENASSNQEVLTRLGLVDIPSDTLVAHLSGGQKTRLSLAGVLMNGPSFLLLDEPTNHLDITVIRWLEEWLQSFKGGLLVVSHDRAFLDGVATSILEMDQEAQTLTAYPGNYSAYLDLRVAEEEKQWNDYRDQQDEIGRLKRSAAVVRSQGQFHKNGKADKKNTDGFSAGFFANRSLETMRRAKNLEKRLEKLLTDERIDKPKNGWQMKLDFEHVPESGRDILRLDDLSIGYSHQTPLLEHLDLLIQNGQRIALVGENGSGKSTLVKTIIGNLPPLSGRVQTGPSIKPGYMAQEQDILNSALSPVEELQSFWPVNQTEIRTFLHKFLFTGDEVFTPVGRLSYGERARLMLACLVVQECNFLILDEPLNHLDIPSRTRFEQALANFNGTVLAVVHDRYFIDRFATHIWKVRDGQIHIEYQYVKEMD
ncbi:MAG: ABC-F family ATP-binding cassette domain-containing protein [Anaerolineales bacterium]|nr:ABC-F family ATP-binding cassette domain-containing protein [Anaerolineales bacterium]